MRIDTKILWNLYVGVDVNVSEWHFIRRFRSVWWCRSEIARVCSILFLASAVRVLSCFSQSPTANSSLLWVWAMEWEVMGRAMLPTKIYCAYADGWFHTGHELVNDCILTQNEEISDSIDKTKKNVVDSNVSFSLWSLQNRPLPTLILINSITAFSICWTKNWIFEFSAQAHCHKIRQTGLD